MENLNSVQLSLPLDLISKPDYKDIIKQNWKFTFSRQKMSSVYTKRTIGLIIAQIKESGYKEYFQILASDIIKETEIDHSNVYRNMRAVAEELISICFFFEDEKEQTFIPRHLVDTTRFQNPVGYHKGVLTVAFNPTLKEIILELAHYSEYELSSYLKCSSWYSMRLFELLSAYRDTGWWQVSINEYRELMGCGAGSVYDKKGRPRIDKKTGKPLAKYPNAADLIERTTREPLKELENTECAFTVKAIFDDEKVGKGRRPITHVRFDLKTIKALAPKNSERIEYWLKTSKNFSKIYERLKKYKISDDIIVKYIKTIGQPKIIELLHLWDLRQLPDSKNRIENVEHYCNKVFSEIGKKAEEEKKNTERKK